MLLDEVIITVAGGDGSPGHISYRREKFIPKGGPDGGNGGRGGDVYFIGVSDLTALIQFRARKEIEADDGGRGAYKKRDGKNAESLYIRIPIGTEIIDQKTGQTWIISRVDQTILITRGGEGGRGNFELRSAQNKTPHTSEPGKPGQKRTLLLNLQFIADIGLIGLPNAGKSSLLNVLTHAHSKVGAYPFTTIEPHLGNMGGLIIADIPGLIEGAHKGKGLGDRFLKHIEKTKVVVHCIDSVSNALGKDYQTIRDELQKYDPRLTAKPEIILLTKSDQIDKKTVEKIIAQFKKTNNTVAAVSIVDDESIEVAKQLFINAVLKRSQTD